MPTLVHNKLKMYKKHYHEKVSLGATSYRRKRTLKKLLRGIATPSKRLIKINKPGFDEVQKQLILKVRRVSPNSGKEKKTIILKRDSDQTISESTVDAILKRTYYKASVRFTHPTKTEL